MILLVSFVKFGRKGHFEIVRDKNIITLNLSFFKIGKFATGDHGNQSWADFLENFEDGNSMQKASA